VNFSNWFWILFIFIPLTMTWAFALIDVFVRDDLDGWMKAVWVIAIIVLPWLGTLLYLIVRPKGSGWWGRSNGVVPEPDYNPAAQYTTESAASELSTLADLHDRGKLTDEEFAAAKQRVVVLSP
jgi:hypothetical protein